VKIAVTGGTGFVGRHLARSLSLGGHSLVLVARGLDRRDETVRHLAQTSFVPIGIDDEDRLAQAFAGCDAVAHCAGINREIGHQTYQRVHIDGTRKVANAAKRAGVKKIVLLSFLRARPDCGSLYHESKWAAEQIVRSLGLDYTVLKPGVIYGRGDHLLDHLSRALRTLPLFALVGITDRPIRPVAVEDVVRLMQASLVEGRLSRRTVAVLGPEEIPLREAVERIAKVIGKRAFLIGMPVFLHYILAWGFERVMTIPLISIAQVRILSEGIAEPLPACGMPPADLRPGKFFTEQEIRQGLPEMTSFGPNDLRWFA